MAWKAETFDVDLKAAGYADATVTVVVNPTGAMVREFGEIIVKVGLGDADAETMERYYAALAKLLVRVRVGGDVLPMDTPETVREFEDSQDPQIVALGLQALWQERTRRREVAAESFRAPNRGGVVRATGPSAATG